MLCANIFAQKVYMCAIFKSEASRSAQMFMGKEKALRRLAQGSYLGFR